MDRLFNRVETANYSEGVRKMRVSIAIASFILLSFSSPTFAQGFFGQILCNGNITDQVRGQWSGSGRFSHGFLDLEIMNNSSHYRITAASVRFEGSYDGREFVRLYENRAIVILPSTSARLWIETDVSNNNVDVDRIRVVDLFGCRE